MMDTYRIYTVMSYLAVLVLPLFVLNVADEECRATAQSGGSWG